MMPSATIMTRLFIVRLAAAALLIGSSSAFLPVPTNHHRLTSLYADRVRQEKKSLLLQEFRLHTGEILNPYAVLKVPRDAELSQIKVSYRKLSRRYHPDIMRHKDILPGSWYVKSTLRLCMNYVVYNYASRCSRAIQ